MTKYYINPRGRLCSENNEPLVYRLSEDYKNKQKMPWENTSNYSIFMQPSNIPSNSWYSNINHLQIFAFVNYEKEEIEILCTTRKSSCLGKPPIVIFSLISFTLLSAAGLNLLSPFFALMFECLASSIFWKQVKNSKEAETLSLLAEEYSEEVSRLVLCTVGLALCSGFILYALDLLIYSRKILNVLTRHKEYMKEELEKKFSLDKNAELIKIPYREESIAIDQAMQKLNNREKLIEVSDPFVVAKEVVLVQD